MPLAKIHIVDDPGKSLFDGDCVVGLGGLELPTKRLSAASSKQLVAISWLGKCPKWRGCVYGTLSPRKADRISMKRFSAPSSLPQKFRFLARRPLPTETPFKCAVRLLPRKAEHLVLPGPLRRQVGEASNTHAMRQSAVDGRFDQIGRKESERDYHVDLSRAEVFPLGDAVRTCCRISDKFIRAATAVSDRCNHRRPSVEEKCRTDISALKL